MSNPLTLFKYKVFCNTESADRYWWLDENQTVPTTCPNDTSHTIDGTQTQVIDTRLAEQSVVINQQVSGNTGGHYRFHTIIFSIQAFETKPYTFSFPFPINMISASMKLHAENAFDKMSVRAGPDTTVGTLESDVLSASNTIHVSDTVIENIRIGYTVNLTDGVNTDELGYVIAIDTDTNILTTEFETTNSFLASTPTSVIMNVWMLKDVELGFEGKLEFMIPLVNAVYVPANVGVLCEYTNISNQVKHFLVNLEFLY